jgi:hypothetical protein
METFTAGSQKKICRAVSDADLMEGLKIIDADQKAEWYRRMAIKYHFKVR